MCTSPNGRFRLPPQPKKRQTKINVSSNHRLPSSIRMLTILSQYSLVKEVISLSYNCCCCYCFSVLRTHGNRAEDSATVPQCYTCFTLSTSLRKKKEKKKGGAGERKRKLYFFSVFYFFLYPAFAHFFLSVK